MPNTTGRNGIAQPGAGRKSAEHIAYQLSRRQLVMDEVTVEHWRKIVRRMIKLAEENGSIAAVEWLSSWVMGAKPAQEAILTIEGEVQVVPWTRKVAAPVLNTLQDGSGAFMPTEDGSGAFMPIESELYRSSPDPDPIEPNQRYLSAPDASDR